MFWDTLRSDIRHTLRMAVKTPLFTAITILALALGIGATSAIFAVVNGVLLRPLPYRDTDRLVNVWSYNIAENRPRNPMSPANFLDFQRMNSTLETLEAYFTFVTPQQLRTAAGTELAYSVFVTPNLINMLGRTAALGRALNVNDVPGVVVLSDGYWRRRFGGDPGIIGQTLDFSQFSAQVVGVMPPDFVFPYGKHVWTERLHPRHRGRHVAADRVLGSAGQREPNAHATGTDRPRHALVWRHRQAEGRASLQPSPKPISRPSPPSSNRATRRPTRVGAQRWFRPSTRPSAPSGRRCSSCWQASPPCC